MATDSTLPDSSISAASGRLATDGGRGPAGVVERAQDDPIATAERFLRAVFDPGDVFEVRLLDCPDKPGGRFLSTWSGYYRDPQAAAAAAVQLDTTHKPRGCYVTANPTLPDLLARGPLAKAKETTKDADVLRRRWLPVDLDPVKPTGVAATDEERAAALALADHVHAELATAGWPAPVRVGSGNGGLLLYHVELPNDADALDLLQRVLAGLAARFNTPTANVDQTMYNAARIIRLPGTVNRKGTDFAGDGDIPARPHRRADLLDVPAELVPVSREQLESVAAPKTLAIPARATAALAAPKTMQQTLADSVNPTPKFYRVDSTIESVRRYLEHFDVAIKREQSKNGYHHFFLARCPLSGVESPGNDTSVSVSVGADRIAYHNKHNRGGQLWPEFREHFEPGYREHSARMKDREASTSASASEAPALTTGTIVDNGMGERQRRLVCVSAKELLERETPPREYLLEPWLRAKDTGMVPGWRGLGKTFFTLGIGGAVASGGRFLRWSAPKPRKVLYIDGELPEETLRERLATVAAACDFPDIYGDNLTFITPDLQDELGMPNLVDPAGQALILPYLEGVYLVVMDNLSTLCRGGAENDAESWQPVQDFILSLRRRGIAVIMVHHAGKTGTQRGTSKREDVLDFTLALKKPADYDQQQGARFEVHFEKARGAYGKNVEPFEVRLDVDHSGDPVWIMKDLALAKADRVRRLAAEGLNGAEIAKEVGCHKSTVSRILNRNG